MFQEPHSLFSRGTSSLGSQKIPFFPTLRYIPRPMAMIAASGIAKHFGTQTLIEGGEFQLSAGDRVGLIGANGTGKTTLFRIIQQETEYEGSLMRMKNIRIAALDQSPQFPEGSSVLDAVLQSDPELGRLHREIDGTC